MKHFFGTLFVFFLFAGYIQAAEIPFVDPKEPSGTIPSVTVSPDGKRIVSATIPGSPSAIDGEVIDKSKIPARYSVGPGGGGGLNNPVVNPHDSQNIFCTCDMGSQFYSTNGRDFQFSDLYGGFPYFFFHPYDENIVYAANQNVIFISHDKGKTYDYFFPQAKDIATVDFDGSEFRPIVKTVGSNLPVSAKSAIVRVLVDPDNTDTVYAISRGSSTGDGFGNGSFAYQGISYPQYPKIYVTRNNGKAWSVLVDAFPGSRDNDPEATSTQKQYGRYIVGGPDSASRRYAHADMAVFKGELHLITQRGYFRFDVNTGALNGHRFFANYDGQFVLSEDKKTLTAYFIMLKDSYIKAGFPDDININYERHIFKTSDAAQTIQLVSDNFWKTLKYSFHGLNLTIPSPSSNSPARKIRFTTIAVSGNTLCVGFLQRSSQATSTHGGVTGIAKTTDDGQTWQWIQHGNGIRFTPSQFPSGAVGIVQIMNGGLVGGDHRDLGISATNPDHIMFSTHWTVYETRDGGVTWRDLASVRRDNLPPMPPSEAREQARFQTTGIEPACQNSMAISKINPKHHLAGWVDIGFWESKDGGVSWHNRNRSLNGTTLGGGQTGAVAIDPFNASIALATSRSVNGGGSGGGTTGANPQGMIRCGGIWETLGDIGCPDDSNSYGAGNTVDTRNNRNRMLSRSTDGGETWVNLPYKIFEAKNGLVFDPNNPGVVYGSFLGAGIWKSTDSGLTWQAWNQGIDVQTQTATIPGGKTAAFVGIAAVEMVLSGDGKSLLVILAHGTETSPMREQAPFYELDIYNNATKWKKISRPHKLTKTMMVSRAPDGTLYAGTSRTLLTTYLTINGGRFRDGENGGVWISTDNGANWRQAFDQRLTVHGVHADSRHKDVVYMVANSNSVYKSTKGKNTTVNDWELLNDQRFSGLHSTVRIWEDPVDPSRIYVPIIGGGTWSVLAR